MVGDEVREEAIRASQAKPGTGAFTTIEMGPLEANRTEQGRDLN